MQGLKGEALNRQRTCVGGGTAGCAPIVKWSFNHPVASVSVSALFFQIFFTSVKAVCDVSSA